MEKNRIPIIAMVVFSIAILLTQDNLAFAEVVFYNQTVSNVSENLNGVNAQNDTSKFIGEEITPTSALIGAVINRISISLEKGNAGDVLQGLAYVGFWDSSAVPTSSNYLKLFGSIDVSTLTTATTTYNFTLSGSQTYTVPANSAFGIFWQNPLGSSITGIIVRAQTGNPIDGTSTRATCYTNTQLSGNADCFSAAGGSGVAQWLDSTGDDLRGALVNTLAGVDDTSAFCQIQANQNLLRCRLEAQGGALGGNVTNNPFDIPTSGSNILIQTGILDGSDTNPATNGTGYLILSVALIIVNGLLFVATHGEAFTRSNLFLPALISLLVVAGFTIASIVDATVLIISIVVMVALAAPKIRDTLGGRGTE